MPFAAMGIAPAITLLVGLAGSFASAIALAALLLGGRCG